MRGVWGRFAVVAALVAGQAVPALGTTTASASSETAIAGAPAGGAELLYVTEGNRLRRIDVDTIGDDTIAEDVLVERAADGGRDINGQICAIGDGRFVAGEDSGQPHPPAGWGVFDPDGTQVGKLTATYFVDGAEPHGCAVAPDGTLFTSEVGFQGFGTANGQLVQWFPPYDRFPGPPGAYPDTDVPSTGFCKLATDLGTAGGIAVDAAGNVYVAESSGLRIEKFAPPFPTGPDAAGGCGGTDATGAPVASEVHRSVFAGASDGMLTFSGVAAAPNGNLYASSVLTGRIAEYAPDGHLVRLILAPEQGVPPVPTGHPQDLAVGADGTIYYADLDLRGSLPDVGPGPNGKVWRIRFDASGAPRAPELIRQGLAFPDGVALFPGDLETAAGPRAEWPTLAGGARRQFFNGREQYLTPETAPGLIERWRFPTGAVVTASPTVATVARAGGPQRLVFVSSWDGNLYALDWASGTEVWRFGWEDQPGASFPAAGSATVADVDGTRLVLFGAGEHLYALDAATGAERWRFAAGTGCRDGGGAFPGPCGFTGERNQVESTPIVHQGVVYFGMDVNDVATGKGGFYAVDAARGTLRWFFDPESGSVCRPDPADEHGPGDQVRRFDGYHSEAELGLPTAFFTTRDGCDHPRTRNGCGNVWSSAALDSARGLLFFGTSNCDTDTDPGTSVPAPPMPPYDEALVALHLDGSPAWRWRPREVDNDDLAFGAVPNLFTISVDGRAQDVVGIGGKDGTYYVLDRTGVNARSGRRWDDAAPRDLPYWERHVVPGGAIGGVIATASVDEATRRVVFSTAPGEDVLAPQRPTVHALDLDTGAVVWQHDDPGLLTGDASYGPTSSVAGLVMVGSVVTPHLRLFDARTGDLVADHALRAQSTFSGVASGAAVLDGTLVVGAGIGTRTSGGSSPGDFAAYTPSAVVAMCVPGAPGCVKPVITPGSTSVTEPEAGTVEVSVPVRIPTPVTQSVEVDWRTLDFDARAPGDHDAASGTVVIPPGATEGAAKVRVRADDLDEAREWLLVSFHSPRNATVGGFLGLGAVEIRDSDSPPVLRAGAVGVVEGDFGTTPARVPLALDRPSGRPITVEWRTVRGTASRRDFEATRGTVVIPPGATTATIETTVRRDVRREPLEYFLVRLRHADHATIAPVDGAVLVVDDD